VQLLRRDRWGRVLYSGTGGSDAGDRPFIDARGTFSPLGGPPARAAGFVAETNAAAARVWRCAEGEYESAVVLVQRAAATQDVLAEGAIAADGEPAELITTRCASPARAPWGEGRWWVVAPARRGRGGPLARRAWRGGTDGCVGRGRQGEPGGGAAAAGAGRRHSRALPRACQPRGRPRARFPPVAPRALFAPRAPRDRGS